MPGDKLGERLKQRVSDLERKGLRKGKEVVIRAVLPPEAERGPRYLLEGRGDQPFLRMNANSYLGLSLQETVIAAEESVVRRFGTGPGAVRFISGTYRPHVDLEMRLAAFHGREAAMIFSSAYATVMGVIAPLVDEDTVVLSDALNHNCIINAVRLARPRDKGVYRHLDMADLESQIRQAAGKAGHLLIVTDGVFSMRGDYAPLDVITALAETYEGQFSHGITLVVDDSHGVGALGETGRGTEEITGAGGIDLLVATLGKALGVNGGYVVAAGSVIDYLRETAPFYVYSNPITPAEAAAALRALEILDSAPGRERLTRLRRLTGRLESGLQALGYEVIPGPHPVVPLMIRDTRRTAELAAHLFENGILATGLKYPVVPRGDEEIRFQVTADHTESDIDTVLAVLKEGTSIGL